MRTLFILFLFIFTRCSAQVDDTYKKYFENDSIKYSILMRSGTITNSQAIPGRSLSVEVKLPPSVRDSLKRIPPKLWLEKLEDPKTDWATNLILYDIYKKDPAMIANIFNTRAKWLEIKEGEIAEWRETFKTQK